MARNKRGSDDMDFDGGFVEPGTPGNSHSRTTGVSSAVVQPSPLDPMADLTDGKKILADLFEFDATDMDALIRAKEQANTFAMAAQAQEYVQKMRSQREHEHIRAWTGRTSEERTQDVVDKEWGKEASPRWRTRVVQNKEIQGKPESITLMIPARSKEEAQGRYMLVCGIRSTDHFIIASEVALTGEQSLSQSS